MEFTGAALWVIILLLLIWFVVLFTSIFGLVKRNDISIAAKIFWAAFISLAPVLGLLLYILIGRKARPGMKV